MHDWKIKLSKCAFAQTSISYLGHIISGAGVATDPQKVSAASNWPTPSSTKELRGFLGLAGYYRKFVRHFGILAKPLSELLRKHSLFSGPQFMSNLFRLSKNAVSSALVLALPNFSKPFSIETDASATGIGAVLIQDGHHWPISAKLLVLAAAVSVHMKRNTWHYGSDYGSTIVAFLFAACRIHHIH